MIYLAGSRKDEGICRRKLKYVVTLVRTQVFFSWKDENTRANKNDRRSVVQQNGKVSEHKYRVNNEAKEYWEESKYK